MLIVTHEQTEPFRQCILIPRIIFHSLLLLNCKVLINIFFPVLDFSCKFYLQVKRQQQHWQIEWIGLQTVDRGLQESIGHKV